MEGLRLRCRGGDARWQSQSAAAIFLVLEINSSLDGLMKISSAPLRKALEFVGQ